MSSTVIPTLRYCEARRMIEWLGEVFGFERHAVYEDDAGGIAQVTAGDCGDDSDAFATDTDSPSMGSFDFSVSLMLSGSPFPPPYGSLCLTDGTTVECLPDSFLDVPTGYIQIALATLSVDPVPYVTGAAPGDLWRTESTATLDSMPMTPPPVTLYDDGLLSYDSDGDESRAFIGSQFWDVSAGAWADETILVFNNPPPVCDTDSPIIVPVMEAFEYDFDLLCVDSDEDSFDVTLEVGTLLSGTSLSMNVWSGTPDTAGETAALTFRVTDEFGAYSDVNITAYTPVVVPDVVGEADFAAADSILEGVGLDGNELAAHCSSAAADEIISQNPAAGASVIPGSLIDLTPSTGIVCWDLTRIPIGWYSIPDVLADRAFTTLMRQEANGDGIWAYWQPGTTIRGSSQLRLNLAIIRTEADGDADWARWVPGVTIRNTGNLQLNMQEALLADFE